LTSGNVRLTASGAAVTFRIAPSGPRDREERPDEAPGAPTAGGNASRRIQAHGGTGRAERPQGHSAGKAPPTLAKAARPGPATRRDVARRTSGGPSPGTNGGREAREGPPGIVGRPQGRRAVPGGDEGGGAPRGEPEAGDPDSLTECGGRLGATEPEEPTGTERFGGRRPEVPRALSFPSVWPVRYRLDP
jgi:hypothetical protein